MTGAGRHHRTVRASVAADTRALHEALHAHPVLRLLTSRDLNNAAYTSALNGFYALYASVEAERARIDIWPDLALGRERNALLADLGVPSVHPQADWLGSSSALLGALYTAHGAAFGRSSFRANVIACLPDAPHTFMRLRTAKSQWRCLLDRMEARAHRKQEIAEGARMAFALLPRVMQTPSLTVTN